MWWVLPLLLLPSAVVLAAGGASAPLMHAEVSLQDRASLQRGARMFVNYCMGCHSAKYVRYEKLQKDLGIPKEVVLSNLAFDPEHKIGSTMTIAMSPADGEHYFAAAPPDLSLVARSRGADWIYSFLHGFYAAPDRPSGTDNLFFRGTAMPHVLWRLQGIQEPIYRTEQGTGLGDGTAGAQVIERLETVVPGTLDEAGYARAVLDLVNFLVYLGEPVRLQRMRVGTWVMLYFAAVGGHHLAAEARILAGRTLGRISGCNSIAVPRGRWITPCASSTGRSALRRNPVSCARKTSSSATR